MSLSVMQPYVFPYIGYFNLIESTNEIVFYDDVQFIKGGWINRNRILVGAQAFLFTIPLSKASPNKAILDVSPILSDPFKKKFLTQLYQSYSKAPFYEDVIPLLENFLSKRYPSIADLAINSILLVYDYLDLDISWKISSQLAQSNKILDRSDRLISLIKSLGYSDYINPIGGSDLYSKEYFRNEGIRLQFLSSKPIEYTQFNNPFISNLSIIDVLMFNQPSKVKDFFKSYSLS